MKDEYSNIKELFNTRIAELWLEHTIISINFDDKEIKVHFNYLNKRDNVVYLPFIHRTKRPIIISADVIDIT